MKIYHVKTQEAYDELMVKLKNKGCETFEMNISSYYRGDCCVDVDGKDVSHGGLEFYKKEYPHIAIQEYKAKSKYKTDEYYRMPKEEVVKRLNIKTEKAIDDAEMYRGIINKLEQIYLAKNKDYGNSFEESLDEFGEISGIVRIGDKFNRIKSLSKTEEVNVKDESKIDTLLDMANYCVMQAKWMIKKGG